MARGRAKEGKDGLTDKQRAFVLAYIGEAKFNASEASRLAGYEGKGTTLSAIASENLRKPRIRAAIDAHLEARAASAFEILDGLQGIARDDTQIGGARVRAYELLGKARGLWRRDHEEPPQDDEIVVDLRRRGQ